MDSRSVPQGEYAPVSGDALQVLRLMRQLEDLRLGDLIKEFCDLFVVNPYDR